MVWFYIHSIILLYHFSFFSVKTDADKDTLLEDNSCIHMQVLDSEHEILRDSTSQLVLGCLQSIPLSSIVWCFWIPVFSLNLRPYSCGFCNMGRKLKGWMVEYECKYAVCEGDGLEWKVNNYWRFGWFIVILNIGNSYLCDFLSLRVTSWENHIINKFGNSLAVSII